MIPTRPPSLITAVDQQTDSQRNKLQVGVLGENPISSRDKVSEDKRTEGEEEETLLLLLLLASDKITFMLQMDVWVDEVC